MLNIICIMTKMTKNQKYLKNRIFYYVYNVLVGLYVVFAIVTFFFFKYFTIPKKCLLIKKGQIVFVQFGKLYVMIYLKFSTSTN